MKKHKNIIIGNSGLIKSMNKRLILDFIMNHEAVSRTDISDMSGLTMPTVMRIVEKLIEDGLVSEVGKGDSTGGRKPVLLCINPNTYYFLGTDVSGSIRSVVANIHGEILGYAKRDADYTQGMDGIIMQLKQNMNHALALSRVDKKKIVYSGIGTPGIGFKFIHTLDKFSFEYWSNTTVAYLMQKANFEYPTAFENTARLGALGELKFGVGKYVDNFIFIHADQGIGMGFVSDAKLELGAKGVAGEFGHTSIDFFGQECYCGNRGCIEMYCSTGAIIRDYLSSLLNNGSRNHIGQTQITLQDVIRAVQQQDPTACRVVERAGEILGIGIGNLINLYNPEAIVFGGELSHVLPLYVQRAQEECKRHIFMNAARNVAFYTTGVEGQSASLGAIALAERNFLDDFCAK